jgi:hypothetical protein
MPAVSVVVMLVLVPAVTTVMITTDLCMEMWWCVIMFWNCGTETAEGVTETYCGECGVI